MLAFTLVSNAVSFPENQKVLQNAVKKMASHCLLGIYYRVKEKDKLIRVYYCY